MWSSTVFELGFMAFCWPVVVLGWNCSRFGVIVHLCMCTIMSIGHHSLFVGMCHCDLQYDLHWMSTTTYCPGHWAKGTLGQAYIEKNPLAAASLCYCQWLGTVQLHEASLPWQGPGDHNCTCIFVQKEKAEKYIASQTNFQFQTLYF